MALRSPRDAQDVVAGMSDLDTLPEPPLRRLGPLVAAGAGLAALASVPLLCRSRGIGPWHHQSVAVDSHPGQLGPFTSFAHSQEPPQCAIVWMHGLGDDEKNWADILEKSFHIAEHLGPCRFFLPRAPTQMASCYHGRTTSWFDMQKLPLRDSDDPPRHGCSLQEAIESSGRVHQAIDKLVQEHGIPPGRIVVGGFSQGGAMAVLSVMTYRMRLAGAVVFSGLVFFQDQLQVLSRQHGTGFRIFWGHGTMDDILDASLMVEGVRALSTAGFNVTARKYAAGHASTYQEMKDAASFVNELLLPDDASSMRRYQ